MSRRTTAAVLLPVLGIALAAAPGRPTAAQPAADRVMDPFVSINVAQLWDHKAFLPAREARGKAEFAWMVQGLIGVAPAVWALRPRQWATATLSVLLLAAFVALTIREWNVIASRTAPRLRQIAASGPP